MFKLHPKLKEDCYSVGHFDLSQLLLSKDSRFPWFILVPALPDVSEIFHLSKSDRIQLMDESCAVQEALQQLYKPAKLNVAMLGNIVPQLHIHHIARFTHDAAWPGPVWGVAGAMGYEAEQVENTVKGMSQALEGSFGWRALGS